ncbi:MAG: carotenoid biosynthesis protein [Bacteroidetes bacterium]|nr:carotenoid biosynthesis protein [Bacteroidota bacterium]
MKNRKTLNHIALALALIFHTCGIIGILFTSYKDWIIQNTPLHLLIMSALLIITHPSKNKNFYLFLLLTVVGGFCIEAIGVNTQTIFGKYEYGNVLGIKILNVPLIIGFNWFIIIYCTGMITQAYENYMLKKIQEQGLNLNTKMQMLSFLVDAAFLSVFFDWLMEPIAVKLGYWKWQNGDIPVYNYISWMIISTMLLWVFRKLNYNKRNVFSVHLLIIQLLFFLVLRTFL